MFVFHGGARQIRLETGIATQAVIEFGDEDRAVYAIPAGFLFRPLRIPAVFA
jgi:hypothetical protein